MGRGEVNWGGAGLVVGVTSVHTKTERQAG